MDSTVREAEEWNLALAVGVFHLGVWVGACVGKCVYLSVCTFPHGFLWCYRGNWMCDAHQKSPLAPGKCFLNPSMPPWKAQPKVRLILSTGKHQMLPCSLCHSLCLSIPPQHQRKTPKHVITVHMCGGVCSSRSPQLCWLTIAGDFPVTSVFGGSGEPILLSWIRHSRWVLKW